MSVWRLVLLMILCVFTLHGLLALAFPDHARLLMAGAAGTSLGWALSAVILSTLFRHQRRASTAELARMADNNRRITELRYTR